MKKKQTKPKAISNLNFLASLYLHHRNRDTAVGLNHDSVMTHSILEQAKQIAIHEIGDVARMMERAAELQAILTANHMKQRQLAKMAKGYKGNGRRHYINERLREVEELYAQSTAVLEELESLERLMTER